jgi:hypothetical protein
VRGYDAGTQRFRYDVNQRFGNTDPRLSAIRSPVAVTLQFRFDLGPTRERQLLLQTLDRGRSHDGTKAAEPQLKAQYGSAGLPNPMATMLRSADTLKLTSPQADSLATMNRWYLIRLDSIWAPLAKEFAALPDGYDREGAFIKYTKARQASVDLLIKLEPRLNALLSREQKRKLRRSSPATSTSATSSRSATGPRVPIRGTGRVRRRRDGWQPHRDPALDALRCKDRCRTQCRSHRGST